MVLFLSKDAEQALEQALEAAQAMQGPGTMEDRALALKAYQHFTLQYHLHRKKDEHNCSGQSGLDNNWPR
jgi:hypothetical protein